MPNTAFCGYDGDTNEQSSMCPGYIGGPLTCKLSTFNKAISKQENVNSGDLKDGRYLVGVQSLNFACNVDQTPSLYTKLQALKEWIDYTVENN